MTAELAEATDRDDIPDEEWRQANRGNAVVVRNLGDGKFETIGEYPTPSLATGVNLSDLDRDGKLDDLKLIKAFSDEKAPLVFRPMNSIPADAVTGSASGLDPDISPANAGLQAARVAMARGVPVDGVRRLIAEHTAGRTFGVLGEPHVNVLALNLAVDEAFPTR